MMGGAKLFEAWGEIKLCGHCELHHSGAVGRNVRDHM